MTTIRRPGRRPAAACRSRSGPASCAPPIRACRSQRCRTRKPGGFFSNVAQARTPQASAVASAVARSGVARTVPPAAAAGRRRTARELGTAGSRGRAGWLADAAAVRRDDRVFGRQRVPSSSSNARTTKREPLSLILDPVTMQVVAVGIEPGLGALDRRRRPCRPPARTAPNGSSRRDAPLHGRRDSRAHKGGARISRHENDNDPAEVQEPQRLD